MLLQLPSAGTAGAKPKDQGGLSKPSFFVDVLAVTYELPTGTGDADDDERSAACASAKHHKPRDKAELRAQLGDKDPYRLLELDEVRWRATADDVRKAYRRLVLKYHPDKQHAAAEKADKAEAAADRAEGDESPVKKKKDAKDDANEEDEDDEMFKAITEAFELLSNPKKRREFDSLDDFDDSIPSNFDSGSQDFFATFVPVFERNSRWSEVQPTPLLGSASSPSDDVAAFYNFWFDFKSWRDFADADEYDLSEAGFREERRWMERQNDKLRQKKRKDEKARVQKLIELAYSFDPRVKAMQQEEKDAKKRSKAERFARVEEQRAAAAKAEAEAKAQAAAEAERQKAEAAERKKQKERLAKALRKQRARLRNIVKDNAGPCTEDECEKLCSQLSFDQLEGLCSDLEATIGAKGAAAVDLLRERLRRELAAQDELANGGQNGNSEPQTPRDEPSPAEAPADKRKSPWTEQELTLLTKGANKFPGGVPDRWIKIAEFINHLADPSFGRTGDDVIAKTKELRKEVERKAALLRAERVKSVAGAAAANADKASDKSAVKATDKASDKASDKATDKASDKATDKATDKAPEKVAKTSDKAGDRTPEKGPSKATKTAAKPENKVEKPSSVSVPPTAAPKAAAASNGTKTKAEAEAVPAAATPSKQEAKAGAKSSSAGETAKSSPSSAAPKPAAAAAASAAAAPETAATATKPTEAAEWTASEQKALEQALQRFPASAPERWERIAEAVPGRSRGECVARFKHIVAALKAKKAAATK